MHFVSRYSSFTSQLFDGHPLANDSRWIVTQPTRTARGLAKLLRTLHWSFAYAHTIPSIDGVPNFIGIEQAACVIDFRGQAGSATAEPALWLILCSQ